MKKFIALILAAMMTLCFAACGEKQNIASLEERYVAAAQKYIDSGEIDNAIKLLKSGIEKTKSEKLQKMLDGLNATTTAAQTSTEVTTTAAPTTTTAVPTTTTATTATSAPETSKAITTKKPTQKKTSATKAKTTPEKSVCLKLIQNGFEPEEYSPTITFYSDNSVEFLCNEGEGMGKVYGKYEHSEDDGGESYVCSVNTYNGSYHFSLTRYNRNGQNAGGYYHFYTNESMGLGLTWDGALFEKIS